MPRGPRRPAQQPAGHRRGNPPGRVCVRDRGIRLGQEFAGQRHPRRGPAPRPERRPGQPRRPRPHRGPGAPRPPDRHRPIAHRPHAALQPRHLHQGLRRDPQALRAASRGQGPRLSSPAASVSTSPAGAARPARATAPNKLEMDFLADIWVTCPVCEGHRFNRETLQVRYKGKSIAEVLEMDIQEALAHFENIPLDRRRSCRRCTTWGWIT